MKKTLITLAALVAFIALAANAQAYYLSWTDVTPGPGSTQEVLPGVTYTAHGSSTAYFTDKTTAGIGGIGVSDGNAEIGTTENITITFTSQSQIVSSLSLSMLYAAIAYDDLYENEIAQITAWSGSNSYVYTLAVNDGGTTATWTDITTGITTTITAIDPGIHDHGGLWTLVDPFGTLAVDSLVLTALDNGASGGANSDYCFHSMTTSPTPIPGAVWLLGTGLLGLIGLRGRVKH